jgi:hypothetical protein
MPKGNGFINVLIPGSWRNWKMPRQDRRPGKAADFSHLVADFGHQGE